MVKQFQQTAAKQVQGLCSCVRPRLDISSLTPRAKLNVSVCLHTCARTHTHTHTHALHATPLLTLVMAGLLDTQASKWLNASLLSGFYGQHLHQGSCHAAGTSCVLNQRRISVQINSTHVQLMSVITSS